ncbi:hypothetical protein ACIA49_31840 [Kribbella sp. NPDC051587]|uniref:hypothetical protein n=1 Tax=Kribbella sp. NPDC051587 TaxID=3364119 RepID=UPI0037A1CAEC
MSSGYQQQPQWGPPPPPPRQRNTGLIVSSVAFGVMLIVFVVTAFVAPGFLVGGDSDTAHPAPDSTFPASPPASSAPPSSEPSDQPTSSVPTSSTGIEQDPAYMKPMESFVAKVNARNAAAANAMTCKDEKSKRLTIPRVTAAVAQGPHYVIEYGNSGRSVSNLAGLELGGKLGKREVPKVAAVGNEKHLIYTGGVSARQDSSGWCINAFYSGFSDIDKS